MDRSAVIARLQQFEGCVNYMYRCTGGEVTIGIGHALQTAANASKLNWQTGGAPSLPDRVQSDYQAIAAAPVGQVATAYQHLTQCRMADADIQALVAADVNSFEAQLCKAYPIGTLTRDRRRKPSSTWLSTSASEGYSNSHPC
jgi:GH24 family phage-related lysozyme (muramidase)